MSDTPTEQASSSAPLAAQARRRRLRLILLGVVPGIALLAAAGIYLAGGRYVETDNAYVKADKIPVSAEVSGTVSEVLVKDNQTVAPGQALFRLDPAPFRVTVAEAEARLAQVRTDLAALKASYREKQSEIALARTRYAFARKEQARQADLVSRKFVSNARFDDAKQSTDLAGQEITALEQDLKRIAETLGGSVDFPVEKHPRYLAAVAQLDKAKLDLAHAEVLASLPGTVSKPPKPGQYLAAGNTAMALVVSGHHWVEANFTETDLTYVHPGHRRRVLGHPGAERHGQLGEGRPARAGADQARRGRAHARTARGTERRGRDRHPASPPPARYHPLTIAP